MQILAVILLALLLVAFLIYKINNKFGVKEILILLLVLIVTVLVTSITLDNQEKKVPNLFKEKYEKDRNKKIDKFSFQRVNNLMLTSKENFIYDFIYTIKENGKDILCEMKNVKIVKIEDEYIFENFNDIKEDCSNQ